MKPVNLYDIYKQVKQRARTLKSIETQCRAEVMINAAKLITTTPTLMQVAAFRKYEDQWLNSHDVSTAAKSMANKFEAAIISNNFVIERWPGNRRGTIIDSPDYGQIYCAKDGSKPGQLKIGVTTMKLSARLQKMQTRYGYENIQPLFVINVSKPYDIENYVQSKLRSVLVSGCTKGDSVEWYFSNAIEFARAVVDSVEEHGNLVDEVTLFTGCPNSRSVKLALNRLGVVINRETWI
jgi:hypothetical protein